MDHLDEFSLVDVLEVFLDAFRKASLNSFPLKPMHDRFVEVVLLVLIGGVSEVGVWLLALI